MALRETIGSRLRRLRGDVPQRDFAKELGISYWTYCRCEAGNRAPSVKFLLQIKKQLPVSIDWILTGKETVTDSIPLPDSLRNKIISKYGGCIICSVGNKEAMDIVQLTPGAPAKRKPEKDLVVLCATCQRLFDAGVLTMEHVRILQDNALRYRKLPKK